MLGFEETKSKLPGCKKVVVTGTPTKIRKVTISDAQDMFDNWASNPNVTKFMTWPTHSNIEITKMVLSNWVNSYENFTYYQWGIVIKKTNQLIGTISVVRFKEEINEVVYLEDYHLN